MKSKYLLVDEALLPPHFSKVARAKELIAEGKAAGVSEAVGMVGISRSTFYKYRGMVEGAAPISSYRHAVLDISLRDTIGALSSVLAIISEYGFNIYTITSNPPVDMMSKVYLTVTTDSDSIDIDALIGRVNSCESVINVRLHDLF